MATLAHEFDASQIDTSKVAFEALPAGRYVAQIIDSEMKVTKAKTGKFLELTLEITKGSFKGRKIWDRLNLENPSTQAVDIAQATLATICNAVGTIKVKDSDELHFKDLTVRVAVETSTQFGTKNIVKGYTSKDATTTDATTGDVPF